MHVMTSRPLGCTGRTLWLHDSRLAVGPSPRATFHHMGVLGAGAKRPAFPLAPGIKTGCLTSVCLALIPIPCNTTVAVRCRVMEGHEAHWHHWNPQEPVAVQFGDRACARATPHQTREDRLDSLAACCFARGFGSRTCSTIHCRPMSPTQALQMCTAVGAMPPHR